MTLEIPRNTDFIKYRNDYGQTGKCPVKWCRHPNSWWLCYNCGAPTCKRHQVFNGRIVIKCYFCDGNKEYKRMDKK